MPMVTRSSLPVSIEYPVIPDPKGWVMRDEDNMSESPLHRGASNELCAVLSHWIERTGRDAEAGCNRGLRWDPEHPTWGVDPDVYLIEPAPPPEASHISLRTWEPGVHPPRVAVEVVSENNAEKDYQVAPDKYAASGTYELWVFDPLLLGPAVRGGPHLLQVWRRNARGSFRRVYAGEGPAFSRALSAWIVIVDGGTRVRVSDDAVGTKLWPTPEETERQRAESERQRAESERQRAESERQRAENERQRAETERQRADPLDAALRALTPYALAALPEALREMLSKR